MASWESLTQQGGADFLCALLERVLEPVMDEATNRIGAAKQGHAEGRETQRLSGAGIAS
jgi:hypothetical protein